MTVPAFHRAILITPEPGRVSAEVEDDFHHMLVVLRHDGECIAEVEATVLRAPWTTCPGAEEVVRRSFRGVRMADAPAVRGKSLNCTHLFDLVLFAAAHARETEPLRYDIRVTDAVDSARELRLERNGAVAMRWTERDRKLESPENLVGRTLYQLGDAIAAMEAGEAEMARILRWAGLIALGRRLTSADLGKTLSREPVCFTFQPENAGNAARAGEVIDFSGRGALAGSRAASGIFFNRKEEKG